MRKSKSHSVVIFPSAVRCIPFTVPRLRTSSSYPSSSYSHSHSSSSPSSSDAAAAGGGGDLSSCRPGGARGSDLLGVVGRPRTQQPPNAVCCGVSGRRSIQTTTTKKKKHRLTDEGEGEGEEEEGAVRLKSVAGGDRCASMPCVSSFEGQTTDGKNTAAASSSAAAAAARRKTVDLEHANLLLGIDPSLYLSTESALDDGRRSVIGGWQEEEDDDGEGAGGEADSLPLSLSLSPVGAAFFEEEEEEEECGVGRVLFAIEYDPETERLLFRLLRILRLPKSFAFDQNSRDPFVRICLMPDERRWVQTKFKKKSCNPRFNENFFFQVRSGGDIQVHVSLSYDSDQNQLKVALHSGKNFPRDENEHPPSDEFYVVVNQMEISKVMERKKTAIIKQMVNFSPIFNELFHFKVRSSDLMSTTSLLIVAMRHNAGRKDDQIGRLVFGSFMFARGQELDHWNAMLANEKQSVTRWHTMTQ